MLKHLLSYDEPNACVTGGMVLAVLVNAVVMTATNYKYPIL